jgi:integrase
VKRRRQYGTGSIYQRASDGRWFGIVEAGFTRDGKRRRITVSAKTEAEAKRKRDAKKRELDRGSDVVSRTTVKAWAETWLAESARVTTPNAHTTDRAAVGWIVETIGARVLDKVTPADVRAVRDAVLAGGNGTSTALRYHGTLMRMLKAAQAEGYAVPANTLATKGPKPSVSDRTAMTIDEALAMLEQASALPHGSRWLAAFLYAARQAEYLGLTWPFVDEEQLTIAWQLQPLPYADKHDRSKGFLMPDGYEAQQLKGRMHLVRPKSRAGWRVVPMLPLLGKPLTAWRDAAPESPYPLVWPGADGRWRDENDDRAEWYAMQDRAGVRHPTGRHYKVHEIRHTTATFLQSLGVDEATRIAIMGHSSIASTRAYEHRDLTLIRSALEKVAGRLALG